MNTEVDLDLNQLIPFWYTKDKRYLWFTKERIFWFLKEDFYDN